MYNVLAVPWKQTGRTTTTNVSESLQCRTSRQGNETISQRATLPEYLEGVSIEALRADIVSRPSQQTWSSLLNRSMFWLEQNALVNYSNHR
jgi:ATP-dependent metalloprotease